MTAPQTSRERGAAVPVGYGSLIAEAVRIAPPEAHTHFPWRDLDTIYGPMLPGSLHVISARTGSGKTLLLTNWLDAMLRPHNFRPVAYFPLETPAAEVYQRLVCHHLGVHPKGVLRGDFSAIEGGERRFQSELMALDKLLLGSDQRLWLYDLPRIGVAALCAALERASDEGCCVAIIDHLLRLDLNEADLYSEVSRAIRALKMTAEKTGMVIVVTSQQSRASSGGDKLAWFAPPDLSALKGSGTIEEEADAVLFLHRVLRDDLTPSQLTDIRVGKLPLQEAIQTDIMGVAVGKHRLDGIQTGAQCRLHVHHGIVSDISDDYRRQWDALRHGIHTGNRA
jgi:replicative DNA helicase